MFHVAVSTPNSTNKLNRSNRGDGLTVWTFGSALTVVSDLVTFRLHGKLEREPRQGCSSARWAPCRWRSKLPPFRLHAPPGTGRNRLLQSVTKAAAEHTSARPTEHGKPSNWPNTRQLASMLLLALLSLTLYMWTGSPEQDAPQSGGPRSVRSALAPLLFNASRGTKHTANAFSIGMFIQSR